MVSYLLINKGLKTIDTPILKGYEIYHNYMGNHLL